MRLLVLDRVIILEELENDWVRKLLMKHDDDTQAIAVRITKALRAGERPVKWGVSEAEALMDVSHQMAKLERRLGGEKATA